MISNNLPLVTPTLRSKKIEFNQLKKDLFPKLVKTNLSTNEVSITSNITNTTELLDEKTHVTNENIKKLIKYIFSGNEEQSITEFENNKNLQHILSSIALLKKHRSNNKNYYTKSIIDVAITLYAAYIINTEDVNDKNAGYGGFKNVFESEFKHNFIDFLCLTCGITTKEIEKIKPEYIKHIKLLKGTTYIKLNNFILDINSVANNNMQPRILGPLEELKNSTIRDNLSYEEVKDLKKEAKDYFNEIIKNIETKKKNNPTAHEDKQDLILKIIHFHKIVNVFSRRFSDGKFNYVNYIEIAEKSGIFDSLQINSQYDKLEFINHSIMLNYKHHKGMTIKRILKVPILGISIATTITGMIIGAINALPIIMAAGGIATIGMLICFIVSNIEGLGIYIFLSFNAISRSIDCGDRYNKYTNSTTELFIKLTQAYKNENESIKKSNYKKTECWEHTIKDSAIIGINDTAKHIVAMNNLRDWTTKKNRNKFPIYAA